MVGYVRACFNFNLVPAKIVYNPHAYVYVMRVPNRADHSFYVYFAFMLCMLLGSEAYVVQHESDSAYKIAVLLDDTGDEVFQLDLSRNLPL